MSSLLYLLPNDFRIEQGSKGPILCNNIQGMCLVFFYSKKCVHCQNFLPAFKTLPHQVPGCMFAEANVTIKNQALIQMSRATVTPIEFVPLMILYVNGKPFMKYQGPRSLPDIIRFIIEVSDRISAKQEFTKGKVCKGTENDPIPGYCLSHPYDSTKLEVCWIPGMPSTTGNYKKYQEVFGQIQ